MEEHFDIAQSVQVKQDGGISIQGETSSFGAGDYDIWMMELNENGISN